MGAAMGYEKKQQSLHVVGHFYGKEEAYGKLWPRDNYGYRIMPWYIRSLDGGITWQKADGTSLKLSVTDKTIDVLFDFAGPYDIPWSVDVAIDKENQPHVICAWSYRKSGPKHSQQSR